MGKDSRKNKICKYCIFFVKDTKELEAECEVDENMELSEHCDFFDKKEYND